MSESRPRRSKVREAPESPSGYRQTRRSSTAAKSAKRAERQHRVATSLTRAWRSTKNVTLVLAQGLALAGLALLVLLVVATAVNTFVRWNSERLASQAESPSEVARRAKENVLVVGVEDGKAIGYLALRIDGDRSQVFGVAIPDGAFVDVPGRGFERIGEAFTAGPETALSTVSNFFTVPFESYVVVPAQAYRDALTAQQVSGLSGASLDSNLTPNELEALDTALGSVAQKDVALVPMPVKPIKLGDQTYYEPQRDEIADLLKSWWGVNPETVEQMTRVIVYNGAGKPGLAGQAAQHLIRSGFRVVDTKNADSFEYKRTEITVKRGEAADGEAVRDALGVGTVRVETSTADVTDVIVVIGRDYKPKPVVKGDQ